MSAILLPVITQDAAGNLLAGGRYLPRILGASAVAVSCPADTTEDILATITIPAGAMGLNGILRISTVWTWTNSVNLKSPRIRLGGIGGTAYLANSFSTTVQMCDLRMIMNRGAANSQVGFLVPAATGTGATATANTISAIDTSAATTLVITGQKATAGETLTLESYLVELILP